MTLAHRRTRLSARRLALMVGAAAATLAALPATAAVANGRPGGRDAVTLAVYGDAPYGVSNADTAQFEALPAFIDTINADTNVSSVIHVGDLHSGKQFCTEAYDRALFEEWKRFADPVYYTPGDNEWTDCHKAAEGGGDPAAYAQGDPDANLALIRSIYFPRPGVTLGQQRRLVLSQGFAYDRRFPADAQFVENAIWTQADTLFVSINLPGGSNNDQDVWFGAATETPAQTTERTERSAADLRWLDAAFGAATLLRAKSMVIVAQADMWDAEKGAAHQAGYEPFVQKVAARTLAFGRPVLMLNGDSHVYRSDNPLVAGAPCTTEAPACASDPYAIHPYGYDVPNFHRLVVHGSTAPMEWIKLTIDSKVNAPAGPSAFGPFSWTRQVQPLP